MNAPLVDDASKKKALDAPSELPILQELVQDLHGLLNVEATKGFKMIDKANKVELVG
jgi:hypothetical protein